MYEVKDFDLDKWEEYSSKNCRISDEDYHKPSGWKAEAVSFRYKDTSKHCWDYVRVNIYKYGSDGEYMHFNRNYPSVISMKYIVQNDKEYLITSADYQCLTIINLTDKTIKSYAHGDHDKGWAFCPTDIDVSSHDNLVDITIEGCYWGAPYERCCIKDIKNLDEFKFPEDMDFEELSNEE